MPVYPVPVNHVAGPPNQRFLTPPGNGRTRTASLWTYVRDDRASGAPEPPADWCAYTPDRKGEHPQAHLVNFKGVLQADVYAGFNAVYERGDVLEAAC
jgi:transposase